MVLLLELSSVCDEPLPLLSWGVLSFHAYIYCSYHSSLYTNLSFESTREQRRPHGLVLLEMPNPSGLELTS